jgi:CBS domain-containing protein
MGEQKIQTAADLEELRLFTKRLLTDFRALDRMLEEGWIESDVGRVGAEQEVFLVDRHWRPAPRAMEILERIDDGRFTTELAKFNLEFNLDPLDLGGDCLRRMESDLVSLLAVASEAAAEFDTRVVLTGILPTIEKEDLSLESMTPRPRYFALNEAMNRLRGGEYQFRIRGRDELLVTHDNVMLEACNTSFQVHFQVAPEEFAPLYNTAQLVAAPVMAAATNSPLLFGRSLWRETRIALFQQSIDTRAPSQHIRDQSPRVSFGRQWVDDSVLEIFREDIARFRVLLSTEQDEDPFDRMARGLPPKLFALRLHNGTVYRWNRPCYGIIDGKPHLRIENRVLPAGPSTADEIANAAFWFGLIRGVRTELGEISGRIEFDAARENFVSAARLGLGAQFTWPGVPEPIPARDLILGELLDLARAGLREMEFDGDDVDRFLGIVGDRVESGRTGSQWLIDSLGALGDNGTVPERLGALVAATHQRQSERLPVAAWSTAGVDEIGRQRSHYQRVGQLMTTDLFTVNKDELVDLVAYLMNWRHIRHVPVEDNRHRLVGLVTARSMLRQMGENPAGATEPVAVSEVMQADVVTVRPETPSLEAIALMKEHRISCLPVVTDDRRLVGIITERDFMGIAGQLLEQYLSKGRVGDV